MPSKHLAVIGIGISIISLTHQPVMSYLGITVPLVIWVSGVAIGLGLVFLPLVVWFVLRPLRRFYFGSVKRDDLKIGYLDVVGDSRKHKHAIDVWLWVFDRLVKPIRAEFASDYLNSPISVSESADIRKRLNGRAGSLKISAKFVDWAISRLEKPVTKHHQGIEQILSRFSERESRPWFSEKDIAEARDWSSDVKARLEKTNLWISIASRNASQNLESGYTQVNSQILESFLKLKELLATLKLDSDKVRDFEGEVSNDSPVPSSD